MAQRHNHVMLLSIPPINYADAEPVVQSEVDFEKIAEMMEELFCFKQWEIEAHIPDFYLDLKAVSDLRRLGSKDMAAYQNKLSKLVANEARGKPEGLFHCAEGRQMVSELNQHNHCPTMFYISIETDNTRLLKWANERLCDGLDYDTQNHMQIKLPTHPRQLLQSVFDEKIMYQPTANFMPVDTELFQAALRDEIQSQVEKEQGMNVIQKTMHRLKNRKAS